MRQEIAQFDEVSLYAFGLDRVTVQTLRNIVRIVGTATDSVTLPDVAAQVESGDAFDDGAIAAPAAINARITDMEAKIEALAELQLVEVYKALEANSVERATTNGSAAQLSAEVQDLVRLIALMPDQSAALAEVRKVLGTMATQNANAVAITGGTLAGMTSYAGGTASFTTLAASGLVDFSAAGAGQIKFPAAQNASADVNTLDDYEEGSFTPVVTGSTTAGAGTYTLQTGNYVKVGKLVSFSLALVWTAHTGTGNLTITGLPFSAASNAPPCSVTASDLTYSGQVAAYVNGAVISMQQLSSNTAITSVPMDPTSTELRISGQFFV